MIRAIPVERPDITPHGDSPCDTLSILNLQDSQWVNYRAARFGNWLYDNFGIAHACCPSKGEVWLSEELTIRQPKVVFNEALIAAPAIISRLAVKFPRIKFVNLFHGAPSYCCSAMPEASYEFIRMSKKFTNVYAGVVSEPDSYAWISQAKIIHLPNLISVPSHLTNTQPLKFKDPGVLHVSLVARPGIIKNWGGMVAALGILARKRPLKAFVVGMFDTSLCVAQRVAGNAHVNYLRELDVDVELYDFMDWDVLLTNISAKIHVGLACGYSDSLNLIAAEHCLLGIPIVGSSVLDWLPRKYQVSPQDPAGMASLAENLALNPKSGLESKRTAKQLAKRNETILRESLRGLLLDV